ncbi:MAG: DNA/RNA nuclease SfsA, partial [Candidatus Bathyarchaeia archaeon]
IGELMRYARDGGRGIVAFVAAFPGAKAFKPYERGDPEMVRLLKEARCAGVEVRALGIEGGLADGVLRITLTNDDLPVLI